MSLLPTRFPLSLFAQTFGLFLQPIAAGWFTAIVTILRKLVFQGLNSQVLSGNPFTQFNNDVDQLLFVQLFQLLSQFIHILIVPL